MDVAHIGTLFSELVMRYGYLAVFVLIFLECTGIPLPGEIALVSAAIFAGTTHQLEIGLVIATASAAAILGDQCGFWIGRRFGFAFLHRYGPYVHLTEQRLKIGQWLFRRFGGPIVFLGRFTALLRTYAALLAGANRFPPLRFIAWNASGGIAWALVFGLGGYVFGHAVQRVAGPVSAALLVLAIAGVVALYLLFQRYEARLIAEAERMPPDA